MTKSVRELVIELGKTQAQLAKVLGSRSRASELLAGQRVLSKSMMAKINKAWGVPLDDLMPLALKARGS